MKIFLFILITFVVLAILVTAFFFFEIRTKYEKKNFSNIIYRRLNFLAEDNDYLLLNGVKLNLDPTTNKVTTFHHILFADKYIYIIQDVYLEGGISGTYEDTYLTIKDKKNQHSAKLNNFLLEQRSNIEMLARKLQIDPEESFLFNIVVYNSDLLVSPGLQRREYCEWFIPLRELIKLIKLSEKDGIKALKKEASKFIFDTLKDSSDTLKSYQNIEYPKVN